jgi:hypothetical protein
VGEAVDPDVVPVAPDVVPVAAAVVLLAPEVLLAWVLELLAGFTTGSYLLHVAFAARGQLSYINGQCDLEERQMALTAMQIACSSALASGRTAIAGAHL